MTELILRPYQEASIEALREGIRNGHRAQLLVAPTGSGKTVCATHLLQEVQRKGTKAAFIVDRVALCAQTSAMLWQYGVQHGVAQSENTFGRLEPIQICSAQTIEKRGFFPDLDVLFIDEAHTQRKAVTQFAQKTKARVIGLTATPFSKGMGETYTNIVNVTTTDKLVAQGFLAPLRVYAAKEIDMTGAKTVGGEWSDREVEKRSAAIIGDIVAEWQDKTQKHFGGPAKTIVFSATVDHGEEICKQFQAAGFNFQQVSYKDGNDDRRASLIAEFRKPDSDIIGLVSCEALAKGFDVPDIMVGICARPYRKSLAAHIQMLGRVMRSSPGKSFAVWLDHTGNYLGFLDDMLDLFENGVSKLDDGERGSKVRKEKEKRANELVCSCGYILLPSMMTCPACGRERQRKARVIQVAGEMVEIGAHADPSMDKYEFFRQACLVASKKDKSDQWVGQQFKNVFGHFPKWPFEPAEAENAALCSAIWGGYLKWRRKGFNPWLKQKAG